MFSARFRLCPSAESNPRQWPGIPLLFHQDRLVINGTRSEQSIDCDAQGGMLTAV